METTLMNLYTHLLKTGLVPKAKGPNLDYNQYPNNSKNY